MENMVSLGVTKFNQSYWNGKKVLVTGHTGFKGSWLTIILSQMGCEVVGMSLKPNTEPSLFDTAGIEALCQTHIIDILDREKVSLLLKSVKPDVVFHLAAQSIVSRGYDQPLDTFYTNTVGTINLLEGLRFVGSIKSVVIVTSDKVYEVGTPSVAFKESDPLGGYDPYSASKAAAELITASYRNSFLKDQGVGVATARAGNVIGGGDWAVDRLIPDAIRAWSSHQSLILRNAHSTRPWQHVLEPLHGYILLAQRLASYPSSADTYNFGPSTENALSVQNVVELAKSNWPGARVTLGEPSREFHETLSLSVDSRKAMKDLGFAPVWTAKEAVELTMKWYYGYIKGRMPLELCLEDVESYYEFSVLQDGR